MTRYIHDPDNPSLPPRRAPTTAQRLRSAGLVILRQEHPYYECTTGVMIYQRGGIFHWFDDAGSGAGYSPEQALSYGLDLGDIVGDEREMKSYCKLILGTPRYMVNDSLYRVMSACDQEIG